VVVVLGGTSPSMRDRKVADLLTQGFKTQRGTGTLIAAKAPQGGQVKAAAPAPADTAAESVVEDVIANILIKAGPGRLRRRRRRAHERREARRPQGPGPAC
jgi:D-alanyl-D-alanine carboxypeptidase